MKHLLLTTIAAVVLVGCGESQQSASTPESKPVEPVAEVPAQPSPPPAEVKPVEPVAEVPAQPSPPPAAVEPPEPIAEAAKPTTPPKAVSANKGADPARGINPELTTAKAPDILITEVAKPESPTAKPANPQADRALIEATATRNVEAVKKAIADGADVNVKDKLGGASLHYAANNSRKEIVELLIAKGADVDAKNKDEWTPLHGAAYGGHKEIAELLIAKDADVNAKNIRGVTPLDFAKGETADLLRKHGGKTGEELN